MLRDIAAMLSDVGVVFMVVEPPEKFPLHGMTRWIDNRVPVIQQTGRWGKDGFVIWTLFHELGHVLNDPRGEMHLEYSTEKKRNSAAEKAANAFAMDVLFGEPGIEPFEGLTRDRESRTSPGSWASHRAWRSTRCTGAGCWTTVRQQLCVDLAGTFSA